MKKIFYLSIFLFPFLFCGCGESAEEKLTAQIPELIQRYVNKKYNTPISENADYKAFTIGNGALMLVSNGVWDIPKKNACTEAHAFRKYDGVKIKINVQKHEIKRLQEIDEKPYTHEAKVFIEYSYDYEVFEGIAGVVVGTVLPPEWNQWNDEKKREHFGKYMAMLPEEKLDFIKLAVTPGRKESTIENEHITIRYSSQTKSWQLDKKYDGGELNAQKTTWDAAAAALIKQTMTGKGLTEINHIYFTTEDAELKKKIDAGYIYANGRWYDKQSAALALALQRHPRQDFTFRQIEQLLFVAYNNQKAEDFETVCKLIFDQTARLIVRDALNKRSLELYQRSISNNAKWQIARKNDLLKNLKNAILNYDKNAAQPLLNKLKGYLAALNEMDTSLKSFVKKNDVVSGLNALKFSDKIGNPSIRLKLCKLLTAWSILARNRQIKEAVSQRNSAALNQWQKELYVTCSNCTNGRINCHVCRNTRLCSRCKGSGSIIGPDLALGSGASKITYRRVSCPRNCSFCPQGTCQICRGTTKVLRSRNVIAGIYRQLYQELENSIPVYQDSLKRDIQKATVK